MSEEVIGLGDVIRQIESIDLSIVQSENGEVSAFHRWEICESETCNEIGVYNPYEKTFTLTAEYNEPEETIEEYVDRLTRPKGDCKDGKRHHWKDGWICSKCGKRRADYVEERQLCKVQYRDVKMFCDLLMFHESQITEDLESATLSPVMKEALEAELSKCRETFGRMMKIESVSRSEFRE